MKPGPLPGVGVPDQADGPLGPPRYAPLPTRLGAAEPRPDEPLAVIVAGPAGAARRDVLAALLNLAPQVLAVPAGSWLVLDHARVPTRAAYVPGYRQPHNYAVDGSAAGPALARPPRRVELTAAEPLLRHFTVVDTPDSDTLGVAGGQILRDAVGRAGALLFVIAADQACSAAELQLLADVGRAGVRVFFVVTPGAAGWAPPAEEAPAADADPVAVVVAAHRAALLSVVPGLAEARWYPARPGDTDALRRALVGWAVDEGLRRASAQPPVPPGTHGRVPVLPDVDPGELTERLERRVRACAQRIRQHLALELANTHLRVVQEIVFRAGCAGLPQLLDRELEALSLLVTAQCDRAVRAILDEAATQVFGAPVADGVRRRIIRAVRFGLADHPAGADLDRVLLVTSTAGVAELTGVGAVDALFAYPGADRDELLPPVTVALSGGCWQRWRAPGNDDPPAARSWAQRALREVELELAREVLRRFEAVRLSLDTVLIDAVDRGILLA